jgi:cellulose synthase/poly-beta-1,6-N-acetylglucosamine synthase-like glycosyltransferase
VNNASTDRTKEIVEDYVAHYPQRIKLLYEMQKGSWFARNKGIQEARSEIISFTDGDCVADPNWLSQLVRTFRESSAQAVQGKILLATPIPEDTWIPEWFIKQRLAHVDYGEKDFLMEEEDLVGANMSFRKEIFKQYGLFNGSVSLSQDTEFSRRITREGVIRHYCGKAIVHHFYDPERITEKCFLQQSYLWGKAVVLYDPQKISDVRYFLYCVKQIFKHAISLIPGYLRHNRQEVFFTKCKIFSHWGRCVQLWQNFLKKERYPLETVQKK